MKKTKCRSCGASVIWAVTDHGKRMPVDGEPSDKGNIILKTGSGFGAPQAVYLDLLNRDEHGDSPLYISHFATCPQASEWRKP